MLKIIEGVEQQLKKAEQAGDSERAEELRDLLSRMKRDVGVFDVVGELVTGMKEALEYAPSAIAMLGFDQLTYGFFGYPLSQAADITFVRANLVPVGEDQKPHIELTRDVVSKFNALYGNGKEIIPLPEALIGEVPRLHALDGSAKMGKSLGNAIALSDPPETVKEMVWKAVTDPEKIRKNDPGHPDICNVYQYHQIFQGTLNKTPDVVAEIERDCRSGALGCVECKGRLTDYLNTMLAPIRDRRRPYEENSDRVREILREGTKKAQREGRETLAMVKEAMKIDYFQLD